MNPSHQDHLLVQYLHKAFNQEDYIGGVNSATAADTERYCASLGRHEVANWPDT